MKKLVILVPTAWLLTQFCVCGGINLQEVLKDPFTAFIIHASWPKEDYIRTHQCDPALCKAGVEMLQTNLVRLLRPAYRPSEDHIRNAIGLTNYMAETEGLPYTIRSNDYIMVQYISKTGQKIMIQDGMFLYVSVSVDPTRCGFADNVTNFIRSVAEEVLNYPAGKVPQRIGASTLNISGSRLGHIYWERHPMRPTDWYHQVTWWSDGKQVLFELSTWTHEQFAAAAMRASCPPMSPRSFSETPNIIPYRTLPPDPMFPVPVSDRK